MRYSEDWNVAESTFCIVGSPAYNQSTIGIGSINGEKLRGAARICEIPVDFLSVVQLGEELCHLIFKGLPNRSMGTPKNPEPTCRSASRCPRPKSNRSPVVNLDRSPNQPGNESRCWRVVTPCKALSVRGCRLSQKDLEPLVAMKLMTELQVPARSKSAAQVWNP